ncbi:MAG: phosphoribosylglycinamide formyltransferase [Phycisphaeraceae bacterium]
MPRPAPANAEFIAPIVRHAPIHLAVLISGSGTTMQHLARLIEGGELDARISVVISSRPDAAGVELAQGLGLATFVVPRKGYDNTADFSAHVFGVARDAGADLVCMAGFLSLLQIPDDYASNVLNIHPALLPAFGGQGMYGRHVHEAVLAAGCKVTGCTVHFADPQYDRGPILLQRTCPVAEDDTPASLAARVQAEEREAYPEAIRLIAAGRVRLAQGRTWIGDAPER